MLCAPCVLYLAAFALGNSDAASQRQSPALNSRDLGNLQSHNAEERVDPRSISRLCEAGEFAKAARLIEESSRRRQAAVWLNEGRAWVYREWASSFLDRGEWNEAFDVFAQERRSASDQSAVIDQQSHVIRERALGLLKLGHRDEAQRLMQRAARALPCGACEGEEPEEKLLLLGK